MAKVHKEKGEHEQEHDHGDGAEMRGEFRSGPVAGTAIVVGEKIGRRPLQYAEVDGLAIFEGDIILGPVNEVRAALEAAGDDGGEVVESVILTGQQFRWPNATVPYQIAAGFPNPQRVTDAIAHWQAHTRIRFVPRTAANAAQFPDFVLFQSGDGCSSNVGRRGGQQSVTLGTGCSTGNAIHEIGHTVGLWHEQSREDRDSFVRIEWANIDPAQQHNFDQHISDGDDVGAYDYGSIMHYPLTAFSSNGRPTITVLRPVPPGVVIGQRTALSAGDIAGVAAMYPAPTTIKEVPKDPILDPGPTIKEIRKDPIGDGTFKEIRKDPIFDPTFKEVVRDPVGGGGGTIAEGIGGGLGGGLGRFGLAGAPAAGASPFVMAGPSRFGGTSGDPTGELLAQVQALAEAVASLQQQLAQLAGEHAAIVQALGGGQGGFV